jgi:arsenical pump membrane protein
VQAAIAESVAIALLAASLVVAITRPFGFDEAVVSVPAAGLLVVLGIEPWSDAVHRLGAIGPTVAFLATILIFGHLCAEDGVFDYLGQVAGQASRGDPRRLLGLVVLIAALVTAVLTLDATVVLLTPVVLATTARLGVPGRPHVYACTRLANSASLLLPVSNLTNLLAFTASGLSFGRFALLMTGPWLVAAGAEWGALRLFFRRDLRQAGTAVDQRRPAPRYALVVLGATVSGFVVTSGLHVAPAWAAGAGCLALLAPRTVRRRVRLPRLARAASPGFCLFVLALAVIVDGVNRHGLRSTLMHVVPSGSGWVALLGLAVVAAVLANLVNNLPATLALVPLMAGNPIGLLAVLLGVNIGPNATYGGSLATLLWRRLLPESERARASTFHALGLMTVPALLVLTTTALWLSARLFSG